MASKTKTCDFCGKRCTKAEMIEYKGKYLCDSYCLELWKESYEDDKEKEQIRLK